MMPSFISLDTYQAHVTLKADLSFSHVIKDTNSEAPLLQMNKKKTHGKVVYELCSRVTCEVCSWTEIRVVWVLTTLLNRAQLWR